MNIPKLYTPHQNQRIIHRSKAKYRTVVAGRRFGKSALLLNEALALALQKPRQIAWIILPLYRQAKEIYWVDPDITKYFMPYVMAGVCKADKSELSLHFKHTDSWVRLKGSDNYDSLRGSGIDFIGWDEVADVKQEAFETIEPALADSPDHRVLYIGTPKGLNWFHDFTLKGDHKKQFPDFGKTIKPHKDWESWHFTSYDNLSWPEGSHERKTFVAYIDEKRDEAEEKGKLSWFNQEYMASFEEGAGRFFPRWNWNTHGLDKSIIPLSEYDVYDSMDWGRTAPFASHKHVLLPVEHGGVKFKRIVTFKEEYTTDKSPHDQVKSIGEKFDYSKVKRILVDPSMMNPLSDGSMSITDQMIKAFEELFNIRPIFTRGSRNRIARWAAMENWMRIAVDGLPYWMVTKDCPNLIRTIPMMMPDENKPEDLDTTLEDHAVDGVSYFLAWIKWVDSTKMGGISPKKTKRKKQPMITKVDFDAFATIKKSKRAFRKL